MACIFTLFQWSNFICTRGKIVNSNHNNLDSKPLRSWHISHWVSSFTLFISFLPIQHTRCRNLNSFKIRDGITLAIECGTFFLPPHPLSQESIYQKRALWKVKKIQINVGFSIFKCFLSSEAEKSRGKVELWSLLHQPCYADGTHIIRGEGIVLGIFYSRRSHTPCECGQGLYQPLSGNSAKFPLHIIIEHDISTAFQTIFEKFCFSRCQPPHNREACDFFY